MSLGVPRVSLQKTPSGYVGIFLPQAQVPKHHHSARGSGETNGVWPQHQKHFGQPCDPQARLGSTGSTSLTHGGHNLLLQPPHQPIPFTIFLSANSWLESWMAKRTTASLEVPLHRILLIQIRGKKSCKKSSAFDFCVSACFLSLTLAWNFCHHEQELHWAPINIFSIGLFDISTDAPHYKQKRVLPRNEGVPYTELRRLKV